MDYPPNLAELDLPAVMGIMIPIIMLMIPIVAILTRHQQRMAEIMMQREQPSGVTNFDMQQLRGEVYELRERLNQQTIALDGLSTAIHKLSGSGTSELSERLETQL